MHDETQELSRTLIWTVEMIARSGPEERERIASAYKEAQELVAGIPKDKGDARPRIVTCFSRADEYRAAQDIACVGWLLTAMQERINEQNIPDWRKLRKAIRSSVKMLPLKRPTIH
jgi:hypothetical protein